MTRRSPRWWRNIVRVLETCERFDDLVLCLLVGPDSASEVLHGNEVGGELSVSGYHIPCESGDTVECTGLAMGVVLGGCSDHAGTEGSVESCNGHRSRKEIKHPLLADAVEKINDRIR